MSKAELAKGIGVTRRNIVGAGVAAVIALVSGSAVTRPSETEQKAPRENGPHVWLDMDQRCF
jgi:hypothetical protein